MKRIGKSIAKEIKGVKIYAEGLEEIIDVLSRESEEVKITTDEFQFDNLDELLGKYEKSKKVDELTLTISDPYVSVDFRKIDTRLYAADSNALSIGIYEQVDGILKKWIPITAILLNGWYLLVWYLLVQLFLYIGNKILNQEIFIVSTALIFAGTIAWAAYYFCTLWPRFNRIVIPRKLGEEKNFFSRNKYNLILIVIAALVGSFFTLIGTRLYDEYKDDILGVERQKSEIGAKGGEGVMAAGYSEASLLEPSVIVKNFAPIL